MSSAQPSPGELIEFWFRDCRADPERALELRSLWFGGGPHLDAELRRRFEPWVEAAARGELDHWKSTAAGQLALVLLLDQLPRNLYRGTARAFTYDERARGFAHSLIERGLFELSPPEQMFAVMPLMHSEELADQERALEILDRCVESAAPEWRPLLAESREFARDHHNVIARFGRFPHRNAVLGRDSNHEERAFLAEGGDSWGQ